MLLSVLHPDPRRGTALVRTDLDVDAGLPLGDLRPYLARVTGWPGWNRPDLRPAVHDAVLDDTHLTGTHPLVAGSTLRARPGPASPTDAALAHPRHVAVTSGPDCGALLGVPEHGAVSLGAPGARSDVTVGDPDLGLVRVRRRRGRTLVRTSRGGRFVPADRPRSSSKRPRTQRWRARPAVRPGRTRRWHDGEALVLGATTFVLRAAHAPPPRRRRPRRWLGWVAPAVGATVLAAAVRQPLLLLTAALGPLVALAGGGPTHEPDAAPVVADGPLDDPAALVAATVRALDGGPERSAAVPWDADGSIAVTGAGALALGVARSVLVAATGTHGAVRPVLRVSRTDRWRWWPGDATGVADLPSADASPCVVVTDHVDPALARWRGATAGQHRLVLVLPAPDVVPAWCRHAVAVTAPDGAAADATLVTPDGARRVPVRALAPSTARDQLCRALAAGAARDARDGRTDGATVPRAVPLGALPGVPAPDPDALVRAWADPPRAVPFGLGNGGVVVSLDLVADGPHALVAGTTGAGKSALLTTLVLAHALRHPPHRLAALLVDFKGGTGLGALAGLPHVVDHVTDLDPAQAERLLVGLRAELRRREHVLAAAGARDLADLEEDDPAAPPRLLVVVDELRALVDDLPGAGGALARVAAQGRALGVHLVLATQRPAGAVPPDLRANVDLRVALRVASAADSQDVLGVADAAAIDPATPGRALLRRAAGPVQPVQVAHATVGAPRAPVRLVHRPDRPAWVPATPAAAPGGDGRAAARPGGPERSAVDAWVRAAVVAAGGRRPDVPWVPTLPSRVTAGDVADGPGLPLAVADVPDEQRRAPVRWDPARTHLLVVGGPRSGRTTTLVALGTAALRDGLAVHAIGLPRAAVAALRAAGGPLGTVADATDTRRTLRLAELLAAGDQPALLLVDGLEGALRAAAQVARGAGADRLAATWRRSPDGGVAVVASGDVAGGTAAHAGAFGTRLALPTADAALDALAGVPPAWAGLGRPAGRAVLLGAQPRMCQVVLPTDDTTAVAPPGPTPGPDVRPLPVRLPAPGGLRATAQHVDAPAGRHGPGAHPRTSRAARVHVPVGVGGDTATPLALDVTDGLVVAGPPGSGRTSTLRLVARALGAAGARVVRLADAPDGPDGHDGLLRAVEPVAVADLLDAPPDLRDATLLVDDADDLERAHPGLADRWPDLGCPVVAAVTSAAAVGAYRGIAPLLLRRRRAVVLDVTEASSAELVGARAAWLADPGPQPPGRGVLLQGRDATPLQVYAP